MTPEFHPRSTAKASDIFIAQKENLVSFILISEGNATEDISALKMVSDYIVRKFEFAEILLLAAAPGAAWLRKIKENVSGVENLRCIVFQNRHQYDELIYQGLSLSIGDIIYCDATQSVSIQSIETLLDECLNGNFEIVKSVSPVTKGYFPSRMILKCIQLSLFAFLGRQIETDVLRALCLSRSAAARITEGGGIFRYFRLVTLSDQFREARISTSEDHDLRRLDALRRKTQIVAYLVSTAAPRLLVGVALFTMVLCLFSLSYTIYALFVWVLLDDVSAGWTSLSLVLSVLFAANFGVLAAMSIGMLRLLRSSQSRVGETPALEINNSDLFAQASNLNIEIVDNGK